MNELKLSISLNDYKIHFYAAILLLTKNHIQMNITIKFAVNKIKSYKKSGNGNSTNHH